jgi:hypothetical protein
MNTIGETNKSGFEVTTCSRCGGAGNNSSNPTVGDWCFRCRGAKVVLTKRGLEARAKYHALLTKPASEVNVGEFIFSALSLSAHRFWNKVTEVNPSENGRLAFELVCSGMKQRLVVGKDHPLIVTDTDETRLAALREALAYQATLLKNGKPGKERKVD